MGIRKSHSKMTPAEWKALLIALDAIARPASSAPRFRDFVRVHVAAMNSAQGMTWSVHSMPQMAMIGTNFLAWHRWYLALFERQLQRVDPTVSLPYWDWENDPTIPAAFDGAAFRKKWGVQRAWNPGLMPDKTDLVPVRKSTTFVGFQQRTEQVHGGPHNAVGGTMASSSSPADPIFWLHHTMIDRVWSVWQTANPAAVPPVLTKKLQPVSGHPVRFGVTVNDVLDIATLGYTYS
jgi:tyrosinase